MENQPPSSSLGTLAEKVSEALAVGGTHSPEDVMQAIERGDMQCWPGESSVIVTTVSITPLHKTCKVFLVAGDLEEAWRIHDEQIVPWAKDQGCTRMLGEGRMGWVKSAREHGYGRPLIQMWKDL